MAVIPRWLSVALMLGILVSTVVAVATVIVVLLTAKHPQYGETIPPTPDPNAVSISADCPSRPLSMNVPFPMAYQVLYADGDLLNTTEVDIGRCAMEECSTSDGACSRGSNTTCCCQSVVHTELQYFANGTSIIYDNVVSVCGCLVCNFNVSIVGAVVAEGVAIPMASLMVDHIHSLSTDRYGFFEMVVSAQRKELVVTPLVSGYASLDHTYQVILGTVDILEVDLLPVATMQTSTAAIILDMTGSFAANATTKANSLVHFPTNFFGSIDECLDAASGEPDNCIIQYVPVDMRSDDDLVKFGLNFLSGVGVRDRSKRQTTTPRCVGVYTMGWIQVYDDRGQEVVMESSREINITTFVTSALQFAQSMNVYRYDLSGIFVLLDSVASTIEMEDGIEVTFDLPRPPLPLKYIVGTEVDDQCYTVARIFRTRNGMIDRGREPRYLVIFVTRTTLPETVNIMRGYSKECVIIPCTGDLSISMHHYNTFISPSTIQYNLTMPTLPGPVYTSLEDCTARGALGSNATLYFSFFETSSLPDARPVDTLIAEQLASIHCYIQFEVYACPDRYVRVMVSSQQEDGRPLDRVQYLSSASSSPDSEAGSGLMASCQERHSVCMQYDCGVSTIVTASVEQCNKESCSALEYENCLPAPYVHDLSPLADPNVKYNSTTVSSTKGTYSSTHNSDIAYYKCVLSAEAAIVFQCSIDY